MAERVGVLGRLRFDSAQAVGSMNRASKSFGGLNKQAQLMKSGLSDVNRGMSQLALAGTAVAVAGGFAVKKFADFGGQMGAVQAVLQTSEVNFKRLEVFAKELGRTTSFTAVQAAEAMEGFARAGFDTTQVMAGLSPVLSAAEADGIDLATASNIVASNIKAFGLEAEDAAKVADTLAFVSAKTNTNMIQLGEGLKFAAPVANQLGIELEDTTAILGALADIGIKGTLSGTAFKNALLQIAKQAKNGKVDLGGMAIAIETMDDGAVNVVGTFKNVVARLADIPDRAKRTSAAMKLLGLRGISTSAAFDALGKNADKMDALLGRNEEGMSNLAVAAKGAAKRMAEIRLKNLRGDFVRFGSAVDGAAIEIGNALTKTIGLAGGTQSLTGFISDAAAAFQKFGDNPELLDANKVALSGVDQAATDMVKGFLLGLDDVKETIVGTVTFVKELGVEFGIFNADNTEGTVKLVTKMGGLVTVLGAVALAAKATGTVFGGLAKTGIGAAKLIGGAFGAISKVGGGILTKIPGLARVLPGVAGKLGKAVGGLERITASPVRVVNFNEAPGGVGAGAAGGLTDLAGGGKKGKGLRAGLKAAGGLKGLARSALKVAGPLAGAALAGIAIGTAFAELTGSTEKLSNALFKATTARKIAQEKEQAISNTAAFNAKNSAMLFADLAERGLGFQKVVGGERVEVTKAFATERITKNLKKQGQTNDQILKILAGLDDVLSKITEGETPPIIVEATVNVDGKPVAKAVARAQGEAGERAGNRGSAGRRRREQQGRVE